MRAAPAAGVGRLRGTGLPRMGRGSSLPQKPFHLRTPSPGSCPPPASPPCKTHRFARNRSNQHGCRDGAEDRPGAACPGILPQLGESSGKHKGIWDVAPVGSAVHGFLRAGALAPASCSGPIARLHFSFLGCFMHPPRD